ncbi:Tetratricopeptide repeat protein [Planctomycetes bacterium CA13]|uniref:Tetratricopeptide repeat protein n=1 Tax=Novipirellula herctigrandis TaxID=2527986 RepID=A0A5C5ZCE0_9BACT|nr:Tetratricopeptide repeat protein [Planctomycetes bacterium CA13]
MNILRYFNPIQWFGWIGQFIRAWVASLPLQQIPKAIPAFVLLMVLLITGIVAYSDGNRWRSNLMGKQFKAAWDADDYETAELVLRRQIKERPDDTQLVFRLALARDEQDAREDAIEMMRGLVYSRKYQPAARWLLQNKFVGGKWTELEPEEQAELGQLLQLLHEETPDDFQIKRLYADYLIATEKAAAAVPLLTDLAKIQPMQGLRAAAISRQLGQTAQSERLAEATLGTVMKLWEEEPTNMAVALAVAQNQLFLNRHRESVQTLEKALTRAKKPEDAKVLRVAMGDAIVAWVNHIEQVPTGDAKDDLRSLQMLQLAIQYAPNNPRVLTVVVDRVLAAASDDDAEVKKIRDALVKGTSPGIAHFIQGTAALVKDDYESGTMHLKLAAEMLPRSGAILNNLAVALATREDPQLEQALKIANSAIENTTNPTPHFFETRGQILMKLERHPEAVPDLERALMVKSLAPKAHESLAICYQAMGEKEIAEQHQEAAKEQQLELEREQEKAAKNK